MFRRADGWTVPQWEHSRLSGDLAVALCAAMGVSEPDFCGAVALHDWPHFVAGGLFDRVAIGDKSDQQQRQLLARLSGPLPLGPLTELVVLLHWRRLSPDLWEQLNAVEMEERIADLQHQIGLSNDQSTELDRWTELCDVLSFHASFGHEANGRARLTRPFRGGDAVVIRWNVSAEKIAIDGKFQPVHRQLSLYAFQSGYPQELAPSSLAIELDISHVRTGRH